MVCDDTLTVEQFKDKSLNPYSIGIWSATEGQGGAPVLATLS